MLAKLKKLIEKKGYVYVAYHLGSDIHRDTWAIKQWIKRKAIPQKDKEAVKELLDANS